MSNMFENCINLEKLDISKFNCNKVIFMDSFMKNLNNLKELKIPLAVLEMAKCFKNEIKCENIISEDKTKCREFRYVKFDLNSNKMQLMSVDPATNEKKLLMEDVQKSFLQKILNN